MNANKSPVEEGGTVSDIQTPSASPTSRPLAPLRGSSSSPSSSSPLRALLWVPTLYLAMGIPFNLIIGGTAARMYKSLGYSDAQITVALGSIGIAWSLKPLWAAFLDLYRTKKFFVLAMELLISVLLVGVAMTLPAPDFFRLSIALFWIAAFASSTQDICADGVYLTSLSRPEQARWAGLQGVFWNLGKVAATGVLIAVLDRVRVAQQWSEQRMWGTAWIGCAIAMAGFAVWHWRVLPAGVAAQRAPGARQAIGEFLGTATSFFHKRAFWGMIAFVFLYRVGEGLILMEGQLFLQSPVSRGGLGLSAGAVSAIDAVWGTIALLAGSLLGGLFVARHGLARVMVIMALCLNVPHFTYVYLSQIAAAGQGVGYATVVSMVSIEKFGYGFGFVANMIYMMQQLAPGRCTMTHYAFATALMNLVLVPTNMISGPLAEALGFSTFFLVVMFASVPSIWAAWKAPFPQSSAAPVLGDAITADDASQLSAAERAVQLAAGRASICAMLNVLVILIVDARILGSLQERGAERAWGALGFLGASVALTFFLAWRSFRAARHAADLAAAGAPASVYLRNARGAKIATVVCCVVALLVLVVGVRLAW